MFSSWNIGEDFKVDKKGKFKFIYDPDGLPIEIREVKPHMPFEGSDNNGRN